MFIKISVYCGLVLLFVGVSYGGGVFIQKQKQTIQALEKVSNKQDYIQSLYEARKEDLVIRLKAEKYMPHTRGVVESMTRDSCDESYLLFIPINVCNDCFGNIYKYILEQVNLKKSTWYILSPLDSYRENKIYFSQYEGVKLLKVKDQMPESYKGKPVLFKWKNQEFLDFVVINKNDISLLKTYFEYD